MNKQVVVIHGGNLFGTHEEVLAFLENRPVSPERFKAQKDWKNSLQSELGAAFEVFLPEMPNKTNAHYIEWKIWFERMVPFLRDNVIFVGHSLGGLFLAKYLSENVLPIQIAAVLLIAAPFDAANGQTLGDFTLPTSLEKLRTHGGKIFLFYSKDDSTVPFSQSEKYKQALPNAEIVAFEDRQHFKQETFPELIKVLANI